MFQLEMSLENWRRKLADSNSFTKADIDELESHLLDEIDTLKKNTLTEEEAFYVACSRIGSVDLLSSEFSKINFNVIWLKKFLWLLSGYILIYFFQRLINILSVFASLTVFRFTALSSYKMAGLSLLINVIFSTIILCLLFLPKYMILSRLQSKFNFLFIYKRWLLVIVFFLFTVMNTIGFNLINALLARQIAISPYGDIIYGQNIFMLIWMASLCLLFLFLSFKNYNAEEKSRQESLHH
ncbi:MAG: permease prefix domain 1-containing protein [Bacillota bacterium]|nr:permease prefix domain 1-containing protein [Bacillota bacterium]